MAIEIYPEDFNSQCPYRKISEQAGCILPTNEEILQRIDNLFKTIEHPNCSMIPIVLDFTAAPRIP